MIIGNRPVIFLKPIKRWTCFNLSW